MGNRARSARYTERFFALLRMTALDGRFVKCTNVVHSGLEQIAIGCVLRRGDPCDRPSVIRDFQGEDELRPYQQKDTSE